MSPLLCDQPARRRVIVAYEGSVVAYRLVDEGVTGRWNQTGQRRLSGLRSKGRPRWAALCNLGTRQLKYPSHVGLSF